ncbi:succinate dehydrogenase/fumarate reductase flavoprotein subunit, partial [Bacillus fengqiuensis]|nr:succinate dehydrogenase/fumarate reductase flavoprotein subunit [Bacillus fengqiuensis]
MSKGRIIVVGGGLAGLMATIKIAEAGKQADLFSLVPVKRSHSVCAQGGINGAVNTKGEGDSPWEHFDDTVYGGDFLANQPPVKAMCEAAPGIIHLLDRMGVMFNRTPEGLLDFRRFGGTQHHRTAFAGATTGQQLLYALDEQVRRHEVAGLVTKYEGWEFLGVILDDEGACRGIVAQNLQTMEIQSFPADAVIMATGGPGIIFGKSTNSVINTGSAASIVYQQGVYYANGE